MVMARVLWLSTLLVIYGELASQLASGHEVGGLTFEVQDNERFCFYEQFRNASVFILDYQVIYMRNINNNSTGEPYINYPTGLKRLRYLNLIKSTVHSVSLSVLSAFIREFNVTI